MDSYGKLLLSNEAWVKEKLALMRDFFNERSTDKSRGFCGSAARIRVCRPEALPDRSEVRTLK